MPLQSLVRPAVLAALVALAATGCSRDLSTLEPWPLSTDPLVFGDTFPPGVDFQAFAGSKLDAVSIDTGEKHQGTASMKVTVPAPGGLYAGGALTTRDLRNLSGYNAITFWAKASKAATLDVAGLGNDNTGTSKYTASWGGIALTTSWKQYVIPVPLPARLAMEGGLFFFAEGAEGTTGYTIWFDEIRFATVTSISNPRPSMQTQVVNSIVGTKVTVKGTKTVFSVAGLDQTIEHFPGYFSFISSDPAVARAEDGTIEVVGAGSAVITAKLGTVDATGTVTLNATAPPAVPPPTPTLPADDVISLFSNAYADVPVDTWSASWDQADVADLKIAGDDVKVYTNLYYAGIEFTSHPIDATAMDSLHLDVYALSGMVFRVKLVDFGPDGEYGGGDDSESELSFTASSVPPFVPGQWVGLDIPLASFTGLAERAHLAQMVLSGDTRTVYLDNVYFHR